MKTKDSRPMLRCATEAARAAGAVMRQNLRAVKRIHVATQHDIKLELDVRCQKLIEKTLRRAFPDIAILGEEGVLGDPEAAQRWVVDPIDGTVNFTYGIPHACVSIALQTRVSSSEVRGSSSEVRGSSSSASYQTVVGVVYDPFCDELWTAIRGQPARLNGRIIHVSQRRRLGETVIGLGFAKQRHTLAKMLPTFGQLVHRVRKIRIMGAAALSLAYVGAGRLDAYLEYGLRLWDIAAGGLIIECAGGEFWNEAVDGGQAYSILANNGRLRRQLERFC